MTRRGRPTPEIILSVEERATLLRWARFDHVVTDRACRTRPGRVDQTVEALTGEPLAPLADRGWVTAQLGRDLAMQVAVSAGQHPLCHNDGCRPVAIVV